VHLVARVGGIKRKRATASFWASELNDFNYGWKMVNGTCGGKRFRLGPTASKQCEEFAARLGHSSARFEIRGWTIHVKGRPVYDRVRGPHHRLDVGFSAAAGAPTRSHPHGLIGQSFTNPPEYPREGKVDMYPREGHFTTSAMAEGAIDGAAEMYEMAGPHATDFVFSRFDSAEADMHTEVSAGPSLAEGQTLEQLGSSADASSTDLEHRGRGEHVTPYVRT